MFALPMIVVAAVIVMTFLMFVWTCYDRNCALKPDRRYIDIRCFIAVRQFDLDPVDRSSNRAFIVGYIRASF